MRHRNVPARAARPVSGPLVASDLLKVQGGLSIDHLLFHEIAHVAQQGGYNP
jgi:hypothetical protein